jgi:hypothetical protein
MAMFRVNGTEKDMTLGELERFLRAARSIGVRDDQVVYADVSTTGKVQELSTELPDTP